MKTRYMEHLTHGGFLPWLPNIKRVTASTNKLAKCVCGKWTGWLPEEVHSLFPAFAEVKYEILPPVAQSNAKTGGPKPFKHSVSVVPLPLQELEERICLRLPTGELYTFTQKNPVPFIVEQWAGMLKAEVVKVQGHLVWFPEESEETEKG